MSELKATPGPWVAYYPHEIVHNGYTSVETVEGKHIYSDECFKSTLEEKTANANLIAAAPEMYEELSGLAADYHCECGHPRCRIEETRRGIDALLAKARGES